MKIDSAFGTLDSPGSGWLPLLPRPLNYFWWGARALWQEALGFRFEYPIELVPDSGHWSSLHYYIFSDRLFFDMMELDPNGIPCHRTRTLNKFYNPAYIAWYGLMKLEQSLRSGGNAGDAFITQVNWLVDHALKQPDGSLVWVYQVDFKEGKGVLKAPWVSALSQGLVISALVRAHRLNRNSRLIDLCKSALGVFCKDVRDGGVRTLENGNTLYEEYPVYPLPRILDGFLFSLLGLYDLWIEAADPRARNLFQEGVRGLIANLEIWNYENKWSWYGSHGYLAPSNYHTLNRLLLAVLARLSENEVLARYSKMWDPRGLNTLARGKLFLVFFAAKQRSRVRAWHG